MFGGRGRVKKGEKDDRKRVMKGRKAGIRFSNDDVHMKNSSITSHKTKITMAINLYL